MHRLRSETAHRRLRRALHEQHHIVALDLVFDEFVDAHGSFLLAPRGSPGVAPRSDRSPYVAQRPPQPKRNLEPGVQGWSARLGCTGSDLKPHIGDCGVPFMNSTTLLLLTSFSMNLSMLMALSFSRRADRPASLRGATVPHM